MISAPPAKPQLSATLLNYFYFTALLSILIDLGLSSALKGALVGAEEYIAQSMHIGALFSQFTAISAALILTFSAIRSLSLLYKYWGLWAAAFFTLATQLLLFIAMQGRLGLYSIVVMSVSTGLSLLLISVLGKLDAGRFITASGSLVILFSGLSFYDWPAPTAEILPGILSGLSQVTQWATALGLLFLAGRRSRILIAITLCLGLLLALSASAALDGTASTAVVIIGRVVNELASASVASLLQLLPVCWITSLALLQLFTSQKTSERLLTLGVLAVLLPLTPLSLALALAVGWSLTAFAATQVRAPQSPASPSQ